MWYHSEFGKRAGSSVLFTRPTLVAHRPEKGYGNSSERIRTVQRTTSADSLGRKTINPTAAAASAIHKTAPALRSLALFISG